VAARVEAFVCLSGGLDSTGIAVLVREHFRNVVAVGFDLQRPDGRMSEDRQ
jgi:7-cyano-7-deazaguanine synthase in queuosine biosynthesis